MTAPVGISLHEKDVPLAAVLEGPDECLLIDRDQFKLAAPQPMHSRIWITGPWLIVGRVLLEIRDDFQVEKTLSRMPASYTMLIPAREKETGRNAHPDRKAFAVRYLTGEVVVEKNQLP